MTGDGTATEEVSGKSQDKRTAYFLVAALLTGLAVLVFKTRRANKSTLEPPF